MRGVVCRQRRQPLRFDAERRHLPRRTADHHHPGRARRAPVRHRAGRGAGRARRAPCTAPVRRRARCASSPTGRMHPHFDAGYGLEVNYDRRRRHGLPGRRHGEPADQRPHGGATRRLASSRCRLYRQRVWRAHLPHLGRHGQQRQFCRRQLQRRRHHGRACGAEARHQRQLDRHAAGDDAEAGDQRQLVLRFVHWRTAKPRTAARNRPRTAGYRQR